MKPIKHAENSSKKFGGVAEDYLPIHEFMDSSKAHIADHRHRAIFHSSFGCFIVEKVFGLTAKNSAGDDYSPRDVAEQHILEDLGTIPSVQDWLAKLPVQKWMGGGNAPGAVLSGAAEASDPLDKLTNAKEEARAAFISALRAEIATYFAANESVHYMTWTQYTPYFNDGSPCTFSVHEVYPCTADGYADTCSWVELSIFTKEEFKDCFEEAFGDHQSITVGRDLEFHKQDYDHD